MATINVIHGGMDAARATIFGPPDQNTINYFGSLTDRLGSMVSSFNSQILESAQKVYNAFSSNEAIEKAKRLLYGINTNAVNDFAIYEVPYGQTPQANHIMRDYIMANPNVYDLYNNNMVNAFEERWIDTEPSDSPYNRTQYHLVVCRP